MASIGDTTRPEYIYDQATDTWIPVGIGPHSHTPAAIGAIASSIVTTKGDIIAATGSGLVVRQGVGADGSVLVADSSQADGLSYALGNSYAAGKNKIINGDFGVWQRGTSFTVGNGTTYVADRFRTYRDGSGATVTVSRQTFTPGTAPVAGYEGTYFLRYDQSVAGSGGTYSALGQPIEDVRTFSGQIITVSFWAKSNANRTLNTTILLDYGSGGSSPVYPASIGSNTVSLTTSWQRFAISFTIPSASGKTIGANSYMQSYFDMPLNQVFQFDIWGWQVEAGSVATPFQTATGNPASELAACQRYYFNVNNGNSVNFARGGATGSGSSQCYVVFPVPMRISPTFTFVGSASNLIMINSTGGSAGNPGAISSGYNASNLSRIDTSGGSGLTAGNFTSIQYSSGSPDFQFSAEL